MSEEQQDPEVLFGNLRRTLGSVRRSLAIKHATLACLTFGYIGGQVRVFEARHHAPLATILATEVATITVIAVAFAASNRLIYKRLYGKNEAILERIEQARLASGSRFDPGRAK